MPLLHGYCVRCEGDLLTHGYIKFALSPEYKEQVACFVCAQVIMYEHGQKMQRRRIIAWVGTAVLTLSFILGLAFFIGCKPKQNEIQPLHLTVTAYRPV